MPPQPLKNNGKPIQTISVPSLNFGTNKPNILIAPKETQKNKASANIGGGKIMMKKPTISLQIDSINKEYEDAYKNQK